MVSNIIVNLPVKDLGRSKAFFAALGFSFNEQYASEDGACMVAAPNIFVMLYTEAFFQTFIKTPISDARQATEVWLTLSVDSREKVSEVVDAAIAAGGSEVDGADDHGFMFSRPFSDLDGHLWNILWMDPAAAM